MDLRVFGIVKMQAAAFLANANPSFLAGLMPRPQQSNQGQSVVTGFVVVLPPAWPALCCGRTRGPMDTPQSWVEIRRLVSAARPRWAPWRLESNTDDQGAACRSGVYLYLATYPLQARPIIAPSVLLVEWVHRPGQGRRLGVPVQCAVPMLGRFFSRRLGIMPLPSS
ncbi:hypothetical protein HZ326_13406 [Fusarium oxysporum f. sp. albedinis]|nr:hypothetical protein HZ326_13406 [Fusarium oxysporum f. sp. albedinis]